jgi:hypothetical protein
MKIEYIFIRFNILCRIKVFSEKIYVSLVKKKRLFKSKKKKKAFLNDFYFYFFVASITCPIDLYYVAFFMSFDIKKGFEFI